MKDLTGNPSEIAQFLEQKWFEKSGLGASILVCSIGSVLLLTGESDGIWIRLLVAIVAAVLILAIWLYSRKTPKTKNGHVGIVIAITCESDEESQRFRADFIAPLRSAVQSGISDGRIELIELPRFLATQISDERTALDIIRKARARLIIYGSVRRRGNGTDRFCRMDLRAAVSHNPISLETSKAFGKEFSEILPSSIKIPADQEFVGFTFTSDLTEIVSKYVLGIAAGLSGDLAYAESMFLEVREKLSRKQGKVPTFTKLNERLPVRLAEVYEARANAAYFAWRKAPSQEAVEDIGKYIKAMEGPGIFRLPSYYSISAIYQFLSDRNVAAALSILKNIRNSGGIWNLNVAFLNAYKGNLKSATRNYKSSAARDVDSDIIGQVEDFLCVILENEPDKYQLHFCLGLFNEHIKGDKLRAIADYKVFIASGDAEEFPSERELARNWIMKLEKEA
jgi:hypothetical protein